ncbi:ABC transporter permease [Catenovulum adriaticum]|uniref:FtsX-like permease family protein n=1 Tax=Catenovulum adriaticum TaxID=2984846 RepID=A0ABY7ALK5_9ALTE|nr:FtsX-like permease family protein [Catenovulum sp. TS8]WAJ69229.1 FtsX-like permease family protein [Catenovulum sp. TS8]
MQVKTVSFQQMFSGAFQLASRLLKQELKRGELSIILAALILAVSSVFSLSMFSERLQGALQDKSGEFLAGDSLLIASREINPEWVSKANEFGLTESKQVRFSSMLFANEQMQLASIRAVDSAYPLKGELAVTDAAWDQGQSTQKRVQAGKIWLDSKLVSQLKLSIGDSVELGNAQFELSEVVTSVPDADLNVFNSGGLALINLTDLEKTGVIQPGSRVSYQLNLIGENTQLTDFQDWVEPQLNRDIHRLRSTQNNSSPILRAVRRAEQYFLLASLLGIVLAATAIAVAASRFCERHFDLVAILKTLGASQQQIKWVFVIQLGLIALVGIGVGLMIGYLGQIAVVQALQSYLPDYIPSGGFRPWWLAVSTGLLSLLLFSVYPLLKLFSIPPLRVLHRQMQGLKNKDWLNWLFSATAIFCLMWLYSDSLKLSLALLASAGVVIVLLLLIARSAIWGSRKAGANAGSATKLALAGLYRRARENSVQLISFTVAIELLLIVLVLRNDLLAQWQSQLPEGTPNYFAVNISETELEPFTQAFQKQSIEIDDTYPVTRGRLTSINDELLRDQVSKEKRDDVEDRQRSIGRELNLTAYPNLPEENELVQGQWWQPNETDYLVSIEEKLSERMGIALGDKLTFNIAGKALDVKVASIRSVVWESMRPNFFMIFNPAVLNEFPATYITSFYVPEETKPKLHNIMSQFPSATLIDIDAIINQIRQITNQVSLAVEFILILVVVAGGLVLIAQVQASLDERRQELVILRTLGAKSSLLRNSVSLEFMILGALAGLFAAMANEIALYILQTQVFNMPASFHWSFWLIGPITGALVIGLLGLASCWKLIKVNTQTLIRALS